MELGPFVEKGIKRNLVEALKAEAMELESLLEEDTKRIPAEVDNQESHMLGSMKEMELRD